MKTRLDVPFGDNEKAKALGARFDFEGRYWYCPDGVDLARLKRWLPKNLRRWLRGNGDGSGKNRQKDGGGGR